nr:8319_t:CDS:2 [Entrophospora candida]
MLTSAHETEEGIPVDDPDFFTLDREWSLLNFLLFRQQYTDFRADRCGEHNRYVRSLASIISYEQASTELIERANDALSLVQKEKKSPLINDFWKAITLVQKRKLVDAIERSVLLDELTTATIYSTFQHDRQEQLVREKITRRLEDIGDDRSYKRQCGQSELRTSENKKDYSKESETEIVNTEQNSEESDTKVINAEQNSEEKDEEEHTRRYNLRKQERFNYTEISDSDIYYYQTYERELTPCPTTRNSLIITPNKPIITRTTYNQISTHIICAFNATVHLVKETTEKNLYEEIEKFLRMRNKLILKSSITKKLGVIFQTDYSEIITKTMIETENEKDSETSEESRFLFFIRHTLLDFIAMFKYLSPKVLVRDMSERSYIVECLSPILRAFRNAFPDVKYEWIEKDVKSLKDASNMFMIDVRPRKADLLVLRLTDATEILYIEVSGPPYKPNKKHTVGDAKKLLVMAICNLCSILSNNFDCPIDDAKKVRSYSIQAIGDRLTLFAISLVDKKKYLAIELASCIIPFPFEAITCYSKIFNFFAVIRNEFIEQEKLQKKIRSFIPSVDGDIEGLREWIHLPDDDLTPAMEDDIDELSLYGTQ